MSEAVEDKFVYARDIALARQQLISPLGIERVVKEGDPAGDVVVAEGMEEAPDLPGFDHGIETNEKPDTPEGRLDHWKRKLLDLTAGGERGYVSHPRHHKDIAVTAIAEPGDAQPGAHRLFWVRPFAVSRVARLGVVTGKRGGRRGAIGGR